jgi:MYXO-CTERM domain-containing protein
MVLAVAAMTPLPAAIAHGGEGSMHSASFTNASYSPAQPMPSFDGSLTQPADAGPSTTTAWLMALGFLGLVVVRRTRSPL